MKIPIARPTVSISDVDRRRVAAANEVLVELVRDRVARSPSASAGSSRPRARRSSSAEDRVLGHVRALAQDRVPGRRGRSRGSGSTRTRRSRAAQTTTGSQSESARESRHGAMIGSPRKRRAVREPGANPGRSRRCEGSCSSAGSHWPAGREGGGEGSPESEDLPRRRKPRTPRGRRIRVSTTHRPGRRRPARVRPGGSGARRCACTCASRARRRRSSARPSRADDRRERARTRSMRRASPASSTTTSRRPRSARSSTRSGSTPAPASAAGATRSTASRRRSAPTRRR